MVMTAKNVNSFVLADLVGKDKNQFKMNRFNDHSPKTRLLKILRDILERPHGYTKKQLAQKYNVHEDTIKNDFEEIRNAGFELTIDKNYRYGLEQEKIADRLEDLLFFTPQERAMIQQSLLKDSSLQKANQRIIAKMENLYDISRISSGITSKAYLSKLAQLEKAKTNRQKVILCDYHSTNSAKVSDRPVEVYHISATEDMIQGYDLERKSLRHYRISRIGHIALPGAIWEHEGKHIVMATDPFGIADLRQVEVHIRMGIGAYNELISHYPLTRAYIHLYDSQNDIYDLECKVNQRFLGISNFLMGYHEHIIQILRPDDLRTFLMEKIKIIDFT